MTDRPDDLSARITAEEDQVKMSVRALAARIAVFHAELASRDLDHQTTVDLTRDFAQALFASVTDGTSAED